MAVFSRTKAELTRSIEAKIRRLRGQGLATAEDRFLVYGAINEAIIDLSLERGLDGPKIITSNDTEDTTAGTNYVDLDSDVIRVVDGTVRIVAEDVILTRFGGGISDFYRFDVGEDIQSSYPTYYCLDTDGSGVTRMLLRGIPDAVYTIAMKVEKMPAEDGISTYPGWYHPTLRSLATAIALESVGLDARADQARYNERIKNIRDVVRGHDGPIHIQHRRRMARPIADELRISGGI